MIEKSPQAYRTISEASALLSIPAHTLRHWEDVFGPLKPLRRSGGRRYYRPNDLDLISGIKHLMDVEGYSVSGVKKILREKGISHVAALGTTEGPPPQPSPHEGKISLSLEDITQLTGEVEAIKRDIQTIRQKAGI